VGAQHQDKTGDVTARVAVANAYGVWFEIAREHNRYMAIRPARSSFQLKDWLAEGMDMALLTASGRSIPVSHAPSHQSRPDTNDPDNHPQPTTDPLSSQTQRGRRGGFGGRPHGTGDDPFGVNDLDEDEPPKGKSKRLEGVTPTKFNGDRSKTLSFLAEFRRFMNMNRDADIARDPYKKCNYFLSLFEGSDTEG
jgi:hypothetical protein